MCGNVEVPLLIEIPSEPGQKLLAARLLARPGGGRPNLVLASNFRGFGGVKEGGKEWESGRVAEWRECGKQNHTQRPLSFL